MSFSRRPLVVSVVVAAALAGCDSAKDKADRKVTAQLDSAAVKLTGDAELRDAAGHDIDTAAGDTSTSVWVQVRAQVLQGQKELRLAQDAASAMSSNVAEIVSLSAAIKRDTDAIAANTAYYESLKKSDPAKVDSEIKKAVQGIKGSDDQPDWVKTDANAIASDASVDKQTADVQSQIDALEKKIQQDTEARNSALTDGGKLVEQSKIEQHQKSVDLFTQGMEANQKAADLGTQIEQNTIKRDHLVADLKVLQVQKESLAATLKLMESRTAEVTDRRTELNKLQADIATKSKNLLGDPVEPPKLGKSKYGTTVLPDSELNTVEAKAAMIDALAAQDKNLARDAQSHFDGAIAAYNNAFTQSGKLEADLSQRINGSDTANKQEALAWRKDREAVAALTQQWYMGDAQLRKALFLADVSAELQARQRAYEACEDTLKKADLPIPNVLVDVNVSLGQRDAETRKAFNDAKTTLADVYGGEEAVGRKAGAQLEAVLAKYAQYLHQMPVVATGEKPAPDKEGDVKNAEGLLSEAIVDLKTASQPGVYVPPLPSDLLDQTPIAPVPKTGTMTPKTAPPTTK